MILYLGNKLSVHGHTPTSVETLGEKLQECDFDIVISSSKKNKFLRLVDMLYSIIKYNKEITVVLIDTYSTSAFWFAYYSSKLCIYYKLPYIPILRGGDLPVRLKSSKEKCIKLFTQSFTNIAVSEYLYHEFKNRNLPVDLIHNYIDLPNYSFLHRKIIQPTLFWVRAFHEIYNPQLAINIFNEVIKQYPNATLTMVGPDKDGSLEKCKSLANKLSLDVTFTGRLSKPEWVELSKQHDIFLNTTNVDNTPVSVMEAMALGMIIITTNAGGIPYLFENGKEGIMVNPNDKQQFVDVISSMIELPGLGSEFSHNARVKAEQWDWEKAKPLWSSVINKAEFSF